MMVSAGKCLMQVFYFHIEKLKLLPGLVRELGVGLHKQMLEVDRKNFIETGTFSPIDELKEGFYHDLEAVMPQIPDNDDVIQACGSTADAFNSTVLKGFELLNRYNEDRSVTDAIAVEEVFDVPIADTVLRGRFDMVRSASGSSDIKSRDLTRKNARRFSRDNLAESSQFDCYALANYRLRGEVNQNVDVVTIYATKSGGEINKVELPVYTERRYDALEEKAYRLHKIIKADAFYPVDKSSQNGWVCQEKYCGAWRAFNRPDDFKGCPFGERARVSV